MNSLIVIAGIFGFLAVAFGAYAEHGLKGKIEPEVIRYIETALRYHLIHTVVVLALGIGLYCPLSPELLEKIHYAGLSFSLGILLFSFSIYLYAFIPNKTILSITPFGGMTLMISWLYCIWIGVQTIK